MKLSTQQLQFLLYFDNLNLHKSPETDPLSVYPKCQVPTPAKLCVRSSVNSPAQIPVFEVLSDWGQPTQKSTHKSWTFLKLQCFHSQYMPPFMYNLQNLQLNVNSLYHHSYLCCTFYFSKSFGFINYLLTNFQSKI